jgi:Holliday junction resolvase RusA-like endonuclease
MTITFFVPGQPVAKGRPIAGRGFNGRTTLRTPGKTAAYEGLIALAANAAIQAPLQGAIELSLTIGVQIPASVSKKRQAAMAEGRIAPTKKPDLDNVVKALCDGMNGIAYADDAQIVAMTVRKVYATTPGVAVELKVLDMEAA